METEKYQRVSEWCVSCWVLGLVIASSSLCYIQLHWDFGNPFSPGICHSSEHAHVHVHGSHSRSWSLWLAKATSCSPKLNTSGLLNKLNHTRAFTLKDRLLLHPSAKYVLTANQWLSKCPLHATVTVRVTHLPVLPKLPVTSFSMGLKGGLWSICSVSMRWPAG